MSKLEEIKENRHPLEIPLFAASVILTVAIFIYLTLFGYSAEYEFARIYYDTGNFDTPLILISQISWKLGIMLYAILFIALFLVRVIRYQAISHNAIKVGEHNFLEVYQKAEEISLSLGLKRVPEIYIVNKNGKIKSSSGKAIMKSYITISYELLENAYSANNDFSLLYFALSREIASLALKQKSWSCHCLSLFSIFIPLLGPSLFRTRCYSADKAATIILEKDGEKEVSAYTIGGKLYSNVSYADLAKESIGGRIFLMLRAIVMPYPTLIDRIRALKEE